MAKKTVKSMILGSALLALGATAASAAVVEVNIYGASAQYGYWTKAAGDFLKSKGCAEANVYTATDGSKHGIAVCSGDTAVAGLTANAAGGMTVGTAKNQTVVVRYASKASYDGIDAVQNKDRNAAPECSGQPGQRKLASTVSWNGNTGTVTATACKDVTIGASDVEAATFKQESHGQLKGHLGGGQADRNVSGYSISSSSYDNKHPLVVPFAFYANNSVETGNMSRLMATQIFSGAVSDWQQILPSAASQPIIVCMRHAGSGTLATLDAAVMRGDQPLVKTEVNSASGDYVGNGGISPLVWFNDGSSDMKACLTQAGAVGYMDADATQSGAKQLTYQGSSPVRANIASGQYDFWSAQNLYYSKSEPAAVKAVISGLMNYASSAANLTTTKIGNAANYWAAGSEMTVTKDNDFQYPYRP